MELLFHLIITVLLKESYSSTLATRRRQFDLNIRERIDTLGPTTNCNDLDKCKDSDHSTSRDRVCANNGKTYPSFCAFNLAACSDRNIKFKHVGECRLKEKCVDQRRNALASRRQKGMFIPKCNPDGTFHIVQCHEYTGYCWCVNIDGTVVGNTDVRGTKPNCTNVQDLNNRRAKGGSDLSNSKSGGCVGKLRKSFNKRMINLMKKDYMNSRKLTKKSTTSVPSEKEALEAMFDSLDKKKDNKLKKIEYRKFRKLVKKMKPSKCAKNFHKFCDTNSDKKISRDEWMACFDSTKIKKADRRGRNNNGSKSNDDFPRDEILDMTPLCKKETEQWQEMYSQGNVTQFKPECDDYGLYKPVQCFGTSDKSIWYCFCVHKHTGNMITNTSVPKGKGTPDCSGVVYKWPDCPDEILFLKKLLNYFHNEIEEPENDATFALKRRTDEEIVRTYFSQTDKNNNNKTEGRERKFYRRIIKKDKLLRKCGRGILKICDEDKDNSISLPEWLRCILSMKSKNEVLADHTIGPASERNPFIEYLIPKD